MDEKNGKLTLLIYLMLDTLKKHPQNTRYLSIVLLISVFIVFYLCTNHLSLFKPRYLPLFNWEKNIPFLPWTVVFYFLAYIQVIFTILITYKRELKKDTSAIICLIIFHGLFFLFYPTIYPRPVLPAETTMLSRIGYNIITLFDSAKNCFPSLHVALSILAALILSKHAARLRVVSFAVTLLTIISTLTLKQHYFLDILGGVFTAIIFYFLIIYVPRRKN